MASIELFLVRHGESLRNLATDLAMKGDDTLHRRLLVDPGEDWPLTALGADQAGVAGEALREISRDKAFVAGYTSPLFRSLETAALLGLECCWRLDSRLRERSWGDFSVEELSSIPTETYLSYARECGDVDWRSPAPGSESIRDLFPALRLFIADMIERHAGGRVVVATHGGTIKALQVILEGFEGMLAGPIPVRSTGNCAVIRYELSGLEKQDWKTRVWQLDGKEAPLISWSRL